MSHRRVGFSTLVSPRTWINSTLEGTLGSGLLDPITGEDDTVGLFKFGNAGLWVDEASLPLAAVELDFIADGILEERLGEGVDEAAGRVTVDDFALGNRGWGCQWQQVHPRQKQRDGS